MELAQVTAKGQATIPNRIREAVHIREGDMLEFDLDSNNQITIIDLSIIHYTVRPEVPKGRSAWSLGLRYLSPNGIFVTNYGKLNKRIDPTIDLELSALRKTLAEWNFPQNDEAWRDL